jgi:hypothetical protein
MTDSAHSLKKWWLPAILIATHTALVFTLYLVIRISHDSEAVALWAITYPIDYPTSKIVAAISPTYGIETALVLVFVGGIHWGVIGVLLRAIMKALKLTPRKGQQSE